MHKSLLVVALALAVVPTAFATGPTVQFTLPVENATPSVFGTLPWPNDLYFDQGRPADGDHTLFNSGSSIGLSAAVIQMNTATVEQALDTLDGFGTTSAIYFFFSGPMTPLRIGARSAGTLSR